MNPINRPWITLVCPIGMWHSCRKYKILVFVHLVSISVNTVPTRSIYTINEHKLIDRSCPFPKVMTCLRVITDISNMEGGEQRVFFHKLGNELRKHQRPKRVRRITSFWGNELATVLIAVVCIALLVWVTLTDTKVRIIL